MSQCDIIIPVWNQWEATKRCLESIEKNTTYPVSIIIIDNASDDKTAQSLADFKTKTTLDISVVRNQENEGFVKAVNKGASLSSAEYICIMNNDTIVSKGWLREMVTIIEENPDIGIVNPSSNNLGQHLPKGITLDEHAEDIKSQKGRYTELGSALGFCMLTKKKIFDKIGPFDEVFGMGNFEDTDFSYRVKKAGHKAVRALGSYVLHEESSSFKMFKHFKRDFEKNKKIFEARWGKPKRLLFIISSDNADDKFFCTVEREIGKNNWVYVAHAGDKIFPEDRHSRIIVYNFGSYFTTKIICKILFKKKKFDEIYCDDANLLNLIKLFRPLHRAQLLTI